MPVTTRPSPSRVGRYGDWRTAVDGTDKNPSRRLFDLITHNCHSPYENDPRRPGYKPGEKSDGGPVWGPAPNKFKDLPLIASSFDSTSARAGEPGTIATYNNGFVDGLIRAFNQDLHLVVRPDDVWQAVISQFSLFVNANAERLRDLFVAHEGKKQLTVDMTPNGLDDIDLGKVAQSFTKAIQDNVVDPGLKQWMLPDFSTTTDHDRAVAAFSTMGVLQQYFEYVVMMGCGLPSVTLLGERADWAELADRIEKLPKYGEECASWAQLLRPVMRHFLLTFDAPDSAEVHDFWMRVAHEAGSEGSGMGLRSLSGWITAFAFFDEHGKVNRNFSDKEARDFGHEKGLDRKRLMLDEISFPLIRSGAIPRALIVLPMVLKDVGRMVDIFTTVISGSIGVSVSADQRTVQPASAWWVVQEFERPIGE